MTNKSDMAALIDLTIKYTQALNVTPETETNFAYGVNVVRFPNQSDSPLEANKKSGRGKTKHCIEVFLETKRYRIEKQGFSDEKSLASMTDDLEDAGYVAM